MDRLHNKGTVGRGGEGVILHYKRGSVTVIPLNGGSFRLFAEAVSTEAAQEIFSITEKEIKNGK